MCPGLVHMPIWSRHTWRGRFSSVFAEASSRWGAACCGLSGWGLSGRGAAVPEPCAGAACGATGCVASGAGAVDCAIAIVALARRQIARIDPRPTKRITHESLVGRSQDYVGGDGAQDLRILEEDLPDRRTTQRPLRYDYHVSRLQGHTQRVAGEPARPVTADHGSIGANHEDTFLVRHIRGAAGLHQIPSCALARPI